MTKIREICLWPSLLSLDAPVIAVLWQLLLARALRVDLPGAATLVLALVLWLIYVGDRILDSFGEATPGEAVRHQFFRRHRMAYGVPFGVVLIAASWIALRDLRPDVRRDGLLLGAVVVFYFALVHLLPKRQRRWFPKEFVVALVFALGTCLAVGARLGDAAGMPFAVTFILFTLILWMNALWIEYSEWMRLRGERSDQPHPLTILAGEHFHLFMTGIGIAVLLAIFDQRFQMERPVLVAEALSVMGLEAIAVLRAWVPIDLVGVAADAALLTPGILLILMSH